MSETADKSELNITKIAKFNGERKSWDAWNVKFLARARKKGCKEILTGGVTVPKDGDETKGSNEEQKKAVKLQRLNEEAYEDLIMAMPDGSTKHGRVVFSLVKNSKPKEHVDGCARTAWSESEKRFQPEGHQSKVILKRQLMKIKM